MPIVIANGEVMATSCDGSPPLSGLSNHHIHTQRLSTIVPDMLHLHHPLSHSSWNEPGNRPGQHPPPDVLMHVHASVHEGVANVLHHYFGEVHQNSSCSFCRSGGENECPQFAFIITPYYSYPNLSDLLNTHRLTNNHTFGGTFPSYMLVNPNDGSIEVQIFAIAVEEKDAQDLHSIGNIFTTIFYSNRDVSRMVKNRYT
ncbi:hypothetical protein BDQ17DRAFT_1426667 [Cyathus striatus]|nr:hypothetical protein BDQ17DRAFT_1426667 [Cyathus striatus]